MVKKHKKKKTLREEEVCRALCEWLLERYPSSEAYLSVSGLAVKGRKTVSFAPEVDVLMIYDDECYAYEVKGPASKSQSKQLIMDFIKLDLVRIHDKITFRPPREIWGIPEPVYTGVG